MICRFRLNAPHCFIVHSQLLVAALVFLVGCGKSESPDVHLERGLMAASSGDMETAIRHFDKALQLEPERVEALYERARAYEALGAGEPELLNKAIEDYDACIKLDPAFDGAVNNKGVCLAKQENHKAAVAAFTQLIEQDPENTLALRNRGLCYHDLGAYDKAARDYSAVIAITKDDAETWFQKGNLSLDQDQPEVAILDFSKAIQVAPGFAKAWMNRGVAKFKLGRPQEGMADLEQARNLDDRILIPELDWGGFSKQGLTPSPQNPAAVWEQAMSTATQDLKARGFVDLNTIAAVPVDQCGVIEAKTAGQTVLVYIAVSVDGQSIRVPQITGHPQAQVALLTLQQTEAGPQSESGFEVTQFIPKWNAAANDESRPTLKMWLPGK